jgi:hypothetical protein
LVQLILTRNTLDQKVETENKFVYS